MIVPVPTELFEYLLQASPQNAQQLGSVDEITDLLTVCLNAITTNNVRSEDVEEPSADAYEEQYK